jgi:hypothetical protein
MMDPCPLEPDEFGLSQSDVNILDSGNSRVKSAEGGQADNGGVVELFPRQESSPDGPSFSDVFPAATGQHISNRESGGNVKTKSTNKPSVRVPVLRIFGPVLRNGDDRAYHKCTQEESKAISLNPVLSSDSSSTINASYSQQPQSGCLYIHGAYPYMLARPVVAGPDGSMHHGHFYQSSQGCSSQEDIFSPKLSSDDSSKRTCIDWDNVESVSRVLDDVHQRLEGSLRASVENSPNPLQPQPSAASSKEYIRSVTIVTGRGFYTYCSGPPAPFLRVEYYDPSMRWRVKMLLEKGLELSSAYHPDPRVYDYEFEGADLELDRNNVDDVRPLKFRCYEAHIPYTMQVFKDYNLAGLKYVNVGDVRFREPLPRTLRKRTKEDFLRKENSNTDNGAFFFRDNVDTELMWPRSKNVSNGSESQQQSIFLEQHWLKKQTSCDLEFDTTVENILNVHDVMTELPSPLEERQKIHWRAVPSLREIWEQERKRMKVLLAPDKDFLSMAEKEDEDASSCSDDSSDDEQYNFQVQDDSTPQFTLNVKKNASVPGSRLAAKGVKKLFSTSDGLEDDFRRALKDIVLRHDKFLDDVDKRIAAGSSQQHSSASLDDGIEALAALGNQFTQLTQNSTEGDEDVAFDSQSYESVIKRLTGSNNYTMTQLTQAEIDEECEILEPSIDHDHYDNEDGHSDDDFICEEEELGEEGFEKTLTYLASQAVASDESNNDLFQYEEEAQSGAPPRYSQLLNGHTDHSDDEASHHPSIADNSNLMIDDDEYDAVEAIGKDSLVDVIGDGGEERAEEHVGLINAPQGIVPSAELVFQTDESLRRQDVEMQEWHPLPTGELNECPSWFGFQWIGSEAESPLIGGPFLEPVKPAPSYNHVRSWLKANRESCASADVARENIASSDFTQMEFTQFSQFDQTQEEKSDPLSGLGQQGCKVQVSGGGGLKTTIHTPSTFTPMTLMSIEVHVQCRIKTGVKGHKEMAMVSYIDAHVLRK